MAGCNFRIDTILQALRTYGVPLRPYINPTTDPASQTHRALLIVPL